MPPEEQPPDQHQVGITNAQENNPDAVIANLTKEMNAHFAAERFSEAAALALQITALSKGELRDTFVRHGVTVLHLDHEAFGIYQGRIEPTYDVRVEGSAAAVLAAATEFGAAPCPGDDPDRSQAGARRARSRGATRVDHPTERGHHA